jgi:dihydrofolate synthase/folylpolyglutamate synthase
MGGRLDATNLISPQCTVITRIGLEHTQYLGGTLAKIAYEKAGIIKEGVTVITAEDNEEALRVIDAVARDRAAPLLVSGRDFKFELLGKGEEGIDVHVHSIDRDVHVPLLGGYQASNVAMACECALEMKARGIELTETDIAIGLGRVRWPGRMEIVGRNPLLVFDVTHTAEGAKVVARELKDLHPGPWVLVIGVLNDKDLNGICAEFGPLADKAVATAPDNRRAYPAEVVQRELLDHCGQVTIEKDVGAAMDRAYELAGPDHAILVTGSLYVIGEAERWLVQRRTRSGPF